MGLSIPHLLVVLAIVIIVFGTKRLKNVGADLGDAIKGFRSAIKESEQESVTSKLEAETLVSEAHHTEKEKNHV